MNTNKNNKRAKRVAKIKIFNTNLNTLNILFYLLQK